MEKVQDVTQKIEEMVVGKEAKKVDKKAKKVKASESAYPLEVSPPPQYIQHRINMFDSLLARQQEALKNKPREEITVTLPDGNTKVGIAYETTPLDIALGIAKSLAEKTVISKVDGELWDLTRPLEKSCKLELLDFESDDGKKVFWHSSAHILGEACERHYGCHLCIGPPIEDGFYYEMGIPDRVVQPTDWPALETIAKSAIKDKQPFVRLEVSKADLLEMFKHNKYKVHIINDKIPDGTSTTVYRCGPLIDLCRGPHVPHTGRIKAFAVMKASASYFLGDAKNDSLQRVYGVSFPDSKQMTEHKKFLEEAAKYDHRKLGKEQELFFFHELSPGSAFMLPHGARIYNKLIEMIRDEYRVRGFSEVYSPNMYNTKLWEVSGHLQNYKENMFCLDVDKEEFALKPMNCPGHCLMFGHTERSYRDLPIRLADFGVLHRNEASGALSGLTRVRRFQQDDAHIFCRQDQIEEEISNCFEFMKHIYGIFGYKFHMKLSTRPEKYIGSLEVWNDAEDRLKRGLEKFGVDWWIDEGDGAFYGPKIDVTIEDALHRKHQCATIQLDYNLPERFDLTYRTGENTSEEAKSRPVIIHRAILGSVERQMGILIEHFKGKWPFWLSPRQVMVVPVTQAFFGYAQEVADAILQENMYVDVDLSDNTLNKKIRNAEIAQYNFVLVVGGEEQSTRSVNVRCRDDVGTKAKTDTVPLAEAVQRLVNLANSKSNESRI
ncbi:Threonine--tRNA ligase, cytoplasmic [Bifiguratus adelaidae]|uniref:Probable threonine--tRNA ligase, cytoplasmic n=1 Tax=Bifiguratus adelaidae TaxID=1938954 RepID=A0A261Y7L2_9FUNG|nr:Threonine--tRNA ligase, cytoplasmic [Bifiguratus adelaidae]